MAKGIFVQTALAVLLPVALAADKSFFFFANQSDSMFAGISSQCNLALSQPIPECPQELLNLLGSSEFYTLQNTTIMNILCRQPCAPALSNYRTTVLSACANDPQPRAGFPATYWVDAVTSVRTQACLKDTASGKYCTDFLGQTLGNAANPVDLLGGYSTTQLCSECIVNLFRHQQSTPYSNYDVEMSQAWAQIQQRCGLNYPTATPTLKTNVTSLGNYAPPGYATAACVGSRTHKVVTGDGCIAISTANHVSTGSLMVLNSLRMDCTDLQLDQTLCLPPACDDYMVQGGDTCISIANRFSTTFQQVVAWNPTINSYCTNLIAGHNICVGPPGGDATFTTVPGATATQTAPYATTTAARPTPVAVGTTPKCGKYYQVQLGDYCEIVALNQTVALPTFLAMNPQIDSSCGNLLSGFYYCVQPTQDFNSTTTSPPVPPPTSTPPGTTTKCYKWYVIVSGDYCAKVQDQFGITFAQLQGWNPAIANDCSNLLLDVAYCVDGTRPKGE
ncbi:peptidoglycan DL-endopeptidase LytF [Microdochium nivale]|nr:peptidoglycan DL-endopeptidase LytF [Microdochium nivale]